MRTAAALLTFLVATLGAFLAGCQGSGTSASPPDRVTLALATIPDTALAQVAVAKGFFREEGVDLTTHLLQYGKPALQEILEGRADFATVAETPLMFSILEGKQVSIVASIMTSSLNHAVLARSDRGIAEVKDLKGKRIATTLETTAEFFLHSLLVTNGISSTDYTPVNLPANRIPEALARGEIDAAATFLPYSMLIQKSLGARCVVFRDKNIYRESFTLAAGKGVAEKRPETVRRMLKALLRAEVFVKEHPDEAQKIVMDYTGLDRDLMRHLWADTTLALSLDQTLLLSLEEESRWAIRYHRTAATTFPNYLDFIYVDGLRSLKPDDVRILK